MHLHHFLKIFDNPTIAGIIVLLGGLYIYRKQKNIDRLYDNEEKLTDALSLLTQRCASVNQIIDMLATTWAMIDKNSADAKKRFFETSFIPETERLTRVLMYAIPEETARIQSVELMYFETRPEIKAEIKNVFEELKKWHNFVGSYLIGKTSEEFNLSKRVSAVPELSLDNLEKAIKKLLTNFSK